MLTPYRDVLSRPGALTFSAAAAVARLPMSMVGIGVVLAVSSLYGSYTLAGAVSATYIVAQAVAAPVLGGWVDRFGQSRVMRPATVLAGAGMLLLAAASAMRAPAVWLFGAAVLIGAGSGSFGSLVRARWTWVLAGDGRAVHTAYSLESALDELVFVVGPVTVTTLATAVRPEAGLVVAAIGVVGGGLWFCAQRATEPPAVRRTEGRARGTVLRLPAMAVLAVVFVPMGGLFGATEVATVAFADEHGNKGAAGFVLATFALGSLLAGLLYGARAWAAPLHRRFAGSVTALAVGVCLFVLVDSLWALAAVMFAVGFTISPSIITGNGLVQAHVPPGRLTEGLTWVGTSLNVGVSIASSLAGAQVDAGGARAAYLVVVACGGAVLVATVLALRVLRAGTPEPAGA
ncbi:MFS transporter [Cellulomonas sp. NTE-D12]|uniref:MFS transporter n=1 Tax=Cellulomonas sp. NTE-D12 TaxID=2962632 RepID=UPI003081ECC6|nr:MFS transporter [Cellulomonas sp. NTE-D12]